MFLVELVKLLFRRILSALLVQKDETSKKDQSQIIICHQNGRHNLEVHEVKNQECYNFLQTLANIASVKKKTTFGIYRTTYIKSDGLIAITELLAQDLLSLY